MERDHLGKSFSWRQSADRYYQLYHWGGEGCLSLCPGKDLLLSLKITQWWSGLWFPKSQGLAGPLSPQVISMVMVSIGVYARLMKHAGEL